eukprot:SAG31_NODE_742_length_12424_cov_16.082353_10_plen_62_part_00
MSRHSMSVLIKGGGGGGDGGPPTQARWPPIYNTAVNTSLSIKIGPPACGLFVPKFRYGTTY